MELQDYVLHLKFYNLFLCHILMNLYVYKLYDFSIIWLYYMIIVSYHTLNLEFIDFPTKFLPLNIFLQNSNQKNFEVCIDLFGNL